MPRGGRRRSPSLLLTSIEGLGIHKTLNADSQQEFWLGVLLNIHREETPERTALRGFSRVRSLRRKEYRRGHVALCHRCSRFSVPYRTDGKYICRVCTSTDVLIMPRFVLFDTVHEPNHSSTEYDPSQVARLEEARKLLPSQQRVVFDCITGRDLSPCSICPRLCKGGIPIGLCDRYLHRIAAWLRSSVSAVNVHRNRLIARLRKELRESGDKATPKPQIAD